MAAEEKTNESSSVMRIDIDQKVRSAYLDYAMSVITARALPDARDGLKPVQRRILYAMGDMNLTHDQPTKKSARIVGEVLGKYHPHSDTAVYDAMVRMAQDFSMRYALVNGQGNFGSVDGDGAAAIRYTEARLAKLGEEMLDDLEMNTVDFIPNYDGSTREPLVLPAKLPNLLVNGANGIAVGMATNIPPHNLGEVADAIAYTIDNLKHIDDISVDDLMRFMPGPDFPTGGSITGSEIIRTAYATGKGTITVRARAHVEDIKGGHSAIIVTELPYQVNKSTLVERIATLVRDGRIEGIGDLRDESDRTGMRIVIELKRGQDAEPVLESLLKLTQMQGSFGINMLALMDGEPRVLPLKRLLLCYIEHRQEVITRRSQFELEKALARAHILEGLLKALDQLDEVIATIRRSRTAETALTNLMEKFKFSELQARAILDMQLRRLAALERQKIQDEYKDTQARIAYLQDLLKHKDKILALVKSDVLALKTAYGDARRTRILPPGSEGSLLEDLVPDEQSLVVITLAGQARRIALDKLRMEEGQVVPGIGAGEAGAVRWLLTAHSKDMLCFINTAGYAQVLAAHQVPDIAQQPQGLPLRNLLHLPNGQQIADVLVVGELAEDRYVTFFTRQGRVKRLALSEIGSLSGGGVVVGIPEGDSLLRAFVTTGSQDLLVITAQGRGLRFKEDEVRPQGRSGSGMRAINLAEGDEVIGAEALMPESELIVVSRYGYAKRCPVSEFNTQGRGGQGVLAADPSKHKDAGLLALSLVADQGSDVVFVTSGNRMVRRALREIPALPRASWGRIVTASRKGAALVLGDDSLLALLCVPAALAASSAQAADTPPAQAVTRQVAVTDTLFAMAEGSSSVGAPSAAKARTARAAASARKPMESTAAETTTPAALITGDTTRPARSKVKSAKNEPPAPEAKPPVRKSAAKTAPAASTAKAAVRPAPPKGKPARSEPPAPEAKPPVRKSAAKTTPAASTPKAAARPAPPQGKPARSEPPSPEAKPPVRKSAAKTAQTAAQPKPDIKPAQDSPLPETSGRRGRQVVTKRPQRTPPSRKSNEE